MNFQLDTPQQVLDLKETLESPGWVHMHRQFQAFLESIRDVRAVPIEGDVALNLGVTKGMAEVATFIVVLPALVAKASEQWGLTKEEGNAPNV